MVSNALENSTMHNVALKQGQRNTFAAVLVKDVGIGTVMDGRVGREFYEQHNSTRTPRESAARTWHQGFSTQWA